MDTTAGTSRPLGRVVDDEPQMRYVITFALETQGFRCVSAADAESAWELLSEESFDLVVLDVMLPGLGGVELCRRIRAAAAVPIILLTALGDEEDRIAGLEAGADDYVTKPFSPRELALRASAVVRRTAAGTGDVVSNGALSVQAATGEVAWEGRPIPLPDTEARLLAALGGPAQRGVGNSGVRRRARDGAHHRLPAAPPPRTPERAPRSGRRRTGAGLHHAAATLKRPRGSRRTYNPID